MQQGFGSASPPASGKKLPKLRSLEPFKVGGAEKNSPPQLHPRTWGHLTLLPTEQHGGGGGGEGRQYHGKGRRGEGQRGGAGERRSTGAPTFSAHRARLPRRAPEREQAVLSISNSTATATASRRAAAPVGLLGLGDPRLHPMRTTLAGGYAFDCFLEPIYP